MKKKSKFKKVSKKPKAKSKGSSCPYDDWACRVYSFCGTQKCANRGHKLRNAPDDEEDE